MGPSTDFKLWLCLLAQPGDGGGGREGVTGIQLQGKSLWNEVDWYSLVRKNSWENLFISLCQNPSNPEDVVKFSEIESGGIHILTILTESSVRQCPYTHLHTCVPQKSRKYTHRYLNWRKASWFDIFILNLQSVIPKVDDTINITYEILNSFPLCSIYETQFFSSRRLHYMAIVPRMSGTIMYATPLDSARFAIPAIFSRNLTFNTTPQECATIGHHMDFLPIFSSHPGLQNLDHTGFQRSSTKIDHISPDDSEIQPEGIRRSFNSNGF